MINRKLPIAIALLFTITSGCSKKTDTVTSFVRFLNASPNSTGLDMKVNGAVLEDNIGYDSASDYLTVSGGNANFVLTRSGASGDVLDANASLLGNVSYTLIAADSVDNIKATIVADDVATPANGKAKVRLLNLIPNSPPYNIFFNGTQVYTGRTFNDHLVSPNYIAYLLVDPGPITMEVKLPGGVVETTFADAPVQPGGVFTVIISGFTTGTGASAVHLKMFQDN